MPSRHSLPASFRLLLLLFLGFGATVFGQASSATSSPSRTSAAATTTSSPSASATVNPGEGLWTYAGCYNETTGVSGGAGQRALNGGAMQGEDTMTPPLCFAFCGSNVQYAGLEYGRECWCADYLSALSNKLDDSECNMPCMGDDTEACGGRLALTLYNRTLEAPASGAGVVRVGKSWELGSLGMGVVVVVGGWGLGTML
ncbi:WSC-domain-containing protein [Aulographum hederae CBS 113979]|uniref:WSC-domain-containing protein n=1 Tax=Aulographum hederae CBS 113979 TaxID=1176131 RepID=A0A6G1GS10_9PEZI|nr:WSC-domain-containing protein [Aulographum hederae CBS 113979]